MSESLVTMIRQPGLDRVSPVELLAKDDEGEFMLKRELAEPPLPIRRAAEFLRVAVGSADQQRDGLDALLLP